MIFGKIFRNGQDMKDILKFSSHNDGLDISVMTVTPEGKPKAVLQIAHGMCGCKERYEPFMEFMAENGVACIANDHRGHGDSVWAEEDLGYMYDDGCKALIEDMREVTWIAQEQFPGCPVYLLGHSMGSLAARAYLKEDDSELSGALICGSPAYSPMAGFGRRLTGLLSRLGLGRMRLKMLQKLISSDLNHGFRAEGNQAWTCSDPAVRDSFASDRKTNFRFTVNGTHCLLGLMQMAYDHEDRTVGNPELPILFLSGEDDPCMGGPSGLDKAVCAMREAGYRNVGIKTYPAMRHEILNEIGKERVWQDILNFIVR